MEEVQQNHQGFRIVQEVWRRRKWLAILIFLGVITTALSVVAFLPDVYRSTATILVERQKVPEAFVQSTVTSGVELRLRTMTQQILSRSRLQNLVERFDLYAELRQQESMDVILARMREDIELEQMEDQHGRDGTTVAFTISYSGSDPQVVARVTNALASFYIEENLKVREQQASNTTAFLRVQLDNVQSTLEELEQRLSQYKERYMGELPEQLEANLAMLERLNTQLRLNGDRQTRIAGQRSALAQQLAEAKRSRLTGGETQPETDAQRLERLRQELAVLRTRYGDRYPDVVQLRAEIAVIEQHLEARPQKSGNTSSASPADAYVRQIERELASLAAEMNAMRAEESNLLQSIQAFQHRVENTPRREQELQVLLRDYESTRELYQSLLKRREEARLSESLEQRQQGEQFRLLEPAAPSSQPAEPDRRKLALVGLMAALGLAAGAVFLVEQLDTSFHTVDELRDFSEVPVLVNLPYITTRADTRRRQVRFGLATVATLVGLVLLVGGSYVAVQGKKPQLTELKGLVTQAQFLLQNVRGVEQ